MRSGNLPRKFLLSLILLVLHGRFTKAANLEFYQDVEPEGPLDVSYEEIARYWEAQKNAKMREANEKEELLLPNLPWSYAEYLYYQRQKEKDILEALLENPRILNALESRKAKERTMIPQSRYDMYKDFNEIEPDESRSYAGIDSPSENFDDSGNFKFPYVKNIFRNEKPRYNHPSYPLKMSPIMTDNDNYRVANTNEERPTLKLDEKFLGIHDNRGDIGGDSSSQLAKPKPEFTFKFNELTTNEADGTFAIRPNDPRYYERNDKTSTESFTSTDKILSNDNENIEQLNREAVMRIENNMAKTDSEYSTEIIPNDKFSIMKIILPEAHRRAEPDSVVVSTTRMMTNDIYFIAIVAGCSAAAMFALVLISLTWCRLHRGAKAAADIEYPAYGVTGPNKDVSPSGDQRLAHSAQMYHFQHQKQQIIAMENRTAASRDPGSVSEAESDEENEEGDYTVYECPGLASTGEMEVKNPMFHDDPTPATPPKFHKEEDHI